MTTAFELVYVRKEEEPVLAPPTPTGGPVVWARQRLFSSPLNAALTILCLLFLAWIIPPLVRWAFVDAVWSGTDRDACVTPGAGACWAFVRARFGQFMYGRYPVDSRWRVDLTAVLLVIGLIPMAIPRVPLKGANAIYLIVFFPVVALILLTGGHFSIPLSTFKTVGGVGIVVSALVTAFGYYGSGRASLPALRLVSGIFIGLLVLLGLLSIDFHLAWVETPLWGGLLVTLVVAIVGIVASMPIGILLALGRRSKMPVVRICSIGFIEFVRGVPLITVLFMASVMLPVFLPPGVNFDKLLRALIGVALFSAAYMAEVIRGGLQAIPRGQYEAAQAMGLKYGPMMRLVILPQALKIVIPGIVNSFISLFKDTSLVLIIGIFDLLGIVQQGFADANWASPQTPATGYAFAGLVYWLFCFSMSRYSIYTERRLHTGHKR